MNVKTIKVKSIVTKSKLPASDYTINPYIGCPHKCKYCYASFMKRFTYHEEDWGDFIDIKEAPLIKNPQLYEGKSIFISSVTDCYNPYEAEYRKTEGILKQLIGVNVKITISTKSDLVIRDIDLLKQFNNVTVAFSINTMDEEFRKEMDNASTIKNRIFAMKTLHDNGIYTGTFISPIFPAITNVEDIIKATKDSCNVYWLENLNLRGKYKTEILTYISEQYPEHLPLYKEIYEQGNKSYWIKLSQYLNQYAETNNINMINYFYHELIRKK